MRNGSSGGCTLPLAWRASEGAQSMDSIAHLSCFAKTKHSGTGAALTAALCI